jgi:hypothetical protein
VTLPEVLLGGAENFTALPAESIPWHRTEARLVVMIAPTEPVAVNVV